jgi:hypothetical protein
VGIEGQVYMPFPFSDTEERNNSSPLQNKTTLAKFLVLLYMGRKKFSRHDKNVKRDRF